MHRKLKSPSSNIYHKNATNIRKFYKNNSSCRKKISSKVRKINKKCVILCANKTARLITKKKKYPYLEKIKRVVKKKEENVGMKG